MDDITDAFLGVDHITIPVRDLEVAERFYVDVLGGRVLGRIDAALLKSLGRPVDPDSLHISITFGSNTRFDLFRQSDGQPPVAAGHPHIAIGVRPEAIDGLVRRLTAHGVPSEGPNRLGGPGQASVYFNDPFGNHLEFATHGYRSDIPVGPPDMAALAYSWAG